MTTVALFVIIFLLFQRSRSALRLYIANVA